MTITCLNCKETIEIDENNLEEELKRHHWYQASDKLYFCQDCDVVIADNINS